MKVTFVVHRINPPFFGGDEIQIMETAKALVRNGVNVEILTADLVEGIEKKACFDGVWVQRFPSLGFPSSLKQYYISRQLLSALSHVDSDILHSSTYGHFPTLSSAICKSKNKKIRYVLQPHYHGMGRNNLNTIIMKMYNPLVGQWIFEKADKIRCLTKAEKDLVIKDFKMPASKVSVIPFGINAERMSIAKKECKKNTLEYRILYVGQLEKFKGIHYLIQGFAKLTTFFHDPVTLRIVGKGSQRAELEKLVTQLNLEGNVSFLGGVSNEEREREYANADLFVLLSELESYSIAVREALFFELPVIVLQIEVFDELIQNGNCFGINVPVDIDELAQKMNSCLIGDLRPKKFDVPTLNDTAKSLITLYNELLETS